MKTKLFLRLRKEKYLQMMALLGIAWIIVFNYAPMYGIIIAFKDYSIIKKISEVDWVGLAWFKEVFTDENFIPIMRNTLAISFMKLIIGFPLPILFAIMLNEIRQVKLKRFVQTVSYLPHFLSWVILGGILMAWLADVGLFNELQTMINPSHTPINYLAKPKYFWLITVFSDIWKELGWSAIIYLAAISGIDPQMYEAATVDGATRFQKIWHITLPSIKGTISILFVLAVANLLNTNFEQILVLKNALNASMAEVIDTYVYRMGVQSGRFSYATAIGLFKSIVALCLLLTANKVTKKLTGHGLY
ncbi:sugar ABC transporter permease [Vallitalea pronyensis]|uniref:Sugar ABC transporter permease n=1 Tax=Vallitalea pronyensis TaxID=1348613 RepID=A0A8J8MNA2_9FIRM|nr:ABC transporter permease subunit [Vallitalea pronyensis]QUI24639.1 sugar ABC transporter permease [Vallitalea pronyensis]